MRRVVDEVVIVGIDGSIRPVSGRDYLWGVVVAVSPMYLVNSYRDMVAGQHFVVQMIVFLLASLGGAGLAGYSIARKTGQDYKAAGLTTGLFAYLAYVVVLLLTGFGSIEVFLEDAVVITGFVGGGVLGAKRWHKVSARHSDKGQHSL